MGRTETVGIRENKILGEVLVYVLGCTYAFYVAERRRSCNVFQNVKVHFIVMLNMIEGIKSTWRLSRGVLIYRCSLNYEKMKESLYKIVTIENRQIFRGDNFFYSFGKILLLTV